MLEQHIEALIFASENPITLKEIQDCLNQTYGWEINEEDLQVAVSKITEKFGSEDFAFELQEIGGGLQFLTKKEYASLISNYLSQKMKKRLSRAALETLSIIAYKQPVTKSQIEQIRGVNCDYTIQKLLEKELIAIAGRSEEVGKPLTYITSESFMDYFGINSPNDLPKLQEIESAHDNEIGNAPDIEIPEEKKMENEAAHDDFSDTAVNEDGNVEISSKEVDSEIHS